MRRPSPPQKELTPPHPSCGTFCGTPRYRISREPPQKVPQASSRIRLIYTRIRHSGDSRVVPARDLFHFQPLPGVDPVPRDQRTVPALGPAQHRSPPAVASQTGPAQLSPPGGKKETMNAGRPGFSMSRAVKCEDEESVFDGSVHSSIRASTLARSASVAWSHASIRRRPFS